MSYQLKEYVKEHCEYVVTAGGETSTDRGPRGTVKFELKCTGSMKEVLGD